LFIITTKGRQNGMEKNDYKLTISINLKAFDSIDARLKSQMYLEWIPIMNSEVKLQRIFKDKPPEKVEL